MGSARFVDWTAFGGLGLGKVAEEIGLGKVGGVSASAGAGLDELGGGVALDEGVGLGDNSVVKERRLPESDRTELESEGWAGSGCGERRKPETRDPLSLLPAPGSAQA